MDEEVLKWIGCDGDDDDDDGVLHVRKKILICFGEECTSGKASSGPQVALCTTERVEGSGLDIKRVSMREE